MFSLNYLQNLKTAARFCSIADGLENLACCSLIIHYREAGAAATFQPNYLTLLAFLFSAESSVSVALWLLTNGTSSEVLRVWPEQRKGDLEGKRSLFIGGITSEAMLGFLQLYIKYWERGMRRGGCREERMTDGKTTRCGFLFCVQTEVEARTGRHQTSFTMRKKGGKRKDVNVNFTWDKKGKQGTYLFIF